MAQPHGENTPDSGHGATVDLARSWQRLRNIEYEMGKGTALLGIRASQSTVS
jgi:hypothetical protein